MSLLVQLGRLRPRRERIDEGRAEDLDWIEHAPVSFSGSAMTTASPMAVFAILADHERWPEWFPLIKRVAVHGPVREGVGVRRSATIPGVKIDELMDGCFWPRPGRSIPRP